MTAQEILRRTDPFGLFTEWYGQIQQIPDHPEPTAMTLATASKSGMPSVRTVLLKRFSAREGFVFFTNFESRKGQDLAENPRAALHFYWATFFRQVTISGAVEKMARSESEAYWNSRPWESRLAGYVSRQSRPVPSGSSLEKIYEAERAKWLGKEIPCPEHWGGFAVQPETYEFWIGDRHRLHDRVRFTRHNGQWQGQQLYP